MPVWAGSEEMNKKRKMALIAMGIAGLEEIVRRHKICLDVYNVRFGDVKIAYNSCMTRLAEHDESLEALNESVEGLGHLSRCGLCADLLQRVRCIEQIQDKREANGHDMHDQRIVTLEMRMHIGIEEKLPKLEKRIELVDNAFIQISTIRERIGRQETSIQTLEQQVKDQRNDYHAHIRQFVEENEAAHKRQEGINIKQLNEITTLQKQVKEINSRLTAAITNIRPTEEVYDVDMLTVKKPGRHQKVKAR